MVDVVHKILKSVNLQMGMLSRRLEIMPHWRSSYDQFLSLATYRNGTYNHLVLEDMLLFHDKYGAFSTRMAAASIISDFGWGTASVGLITFHWAMYEGWKEHLRKYGKEPVNIAAYLEACFDADLENINEVLKKEY